MFGLKSDWVLDPPKRYFTLKDYESNVPRWCPGCGDHAVLTAVQKICRDEQLQPENTVFVSGIGCSSRFPHYMKTYGFHGLHGRALPVACGVKSRRPDLDVWVATGDGDCFSIGAGHWVHAVRYNMDMTVLVFDNAIYGLTKKQTSPTTPQGFATNIHPHGSMLPALDPVGATLGLSNVSYVAQTVDWNPVHLTATLTSAFRHPGFSLVRILQRCPVFTPKVYQEVQEDPNRLLLLTHENGIAVNDSVARLFKQQQEHDPFDLTAAQILNRNTELTPIGLFFQDRNRPRYDKFTSLGVDMSQEEKLEALDKALDRFTVRS